MAKVESGIPHNLRKVYRRLQRWRSLHTGRLPIPERLWAAVKAPVVDMLAALQASLDAASTGKRRVAVQ